MKRPLLIGLVGSLLAVGAAYRLLNIGMPSSLPPLPPQPADSPILVLAPQYSDSDQTPLVALPDLSKVDRSVIEPAGLVKPRYCLLVFGPQASTRIWLMEAGNTLYVDRNANGDLTDAGEAFAPAERKESMTVGEDGKEAPYREWTYAVGDLVPGDGPGRHTHFKVDRYQTGSTPAEYILSVWVGGVTLQYAGWGPLFAESRDTAPVVHFGGPVVPKPLRSSTLRLAGDRQELGFCIGTPGVGNHSFAYVGCEAVPASIRPVVEVGWPSEAAVFNERFALARRCCYYHFYGPVRVPKTATKGTMSVTVSFPGWSQVNFNKRSFAMELVD